MVPLPALETCGLMILLQPSLLWPDLSGLSKGCGRGNVQVERGQLEGPPGSSLKVSERRQQSVGCGRICVSSVGAVQPWAARAGAEQSKQEAAALLWLRAPLPALETIDHLTGKAFPAWVYFALQSSSSLGCKQLPKQ